MKIIEAMKQVKYLVKKAEDIREKIRVNSSDLDIETPIYPEQQKQVSEWLQSHEDIMREIANLKTRIQATNQATNVTIKIGDKDVTKTISEWIYRKDLVQHDLKAWQGLTDRALPQKQTLKQSNGMEREVQVRRYFDPKQRDAKLDLYRQEPFQINASLEVINAVTDLI